MYVAKQRRLQVRNLLLAAVAAAGLAAIAPQPASAAQSPAIAGTHATADHGLLTNVDYYWNRRHWHHRRWEHRRWRYYD